jgi:hypothetical protein
MTPGWQVTRGQRIERRQRRRRPARRSGARCVQWPGQSAVLLSTLHPCYHPLPNNKEVPSHTPTLLCALSEQAHTRRIQGELAARAVAAARRPRNSSTDISRLGLRLNGKNQLSHWTDFLPSDFVLAGG